MNEKYNDFKYSLNTVFFFFCLNNTFALFINCTSDSNYKILDSEQRQGCIVFNENEHFFETFFRIFLHFLRSLLWLLKIKMFI